MFHFLPYFNDLNSIKFSWIQNLFINEEDDFGLSSDSSLKEKLYLRLNFGWMLRENIFCQKNSTESIAAISYL